MQHLSQDESRTRRWRFSLPARRALRHFGRTRQGVSKRAASENCAADRASDPQRQKQKLHSGGAPALHVPGRSTHPASSRSEVTSAARSGGNHLLDVTHCSINIVRSIIRWVLATAVRCTHATPTRPLLRTAGHSLVAARKSCVARENSAGAWSTQVQAVTGAFGSYARLGASQRSTSSTATPRRDAYSSTWSRSIRATAK